MISLGLAVATTGTALKFGDFGARRIGGALLVSWIASLMVNIGGVGQTGWAMFGVDCATLIYFAWISLRTRRLWTILATAFMLLIVASHVATAIDFRLAIDTFRLSMALWSYGILACIAFGTWSGRRASSPTAAGGGSAPRLVWIRAARTGLPAD
jgi:hypothetical protein